MKIVLSLKVKGVTNVKPDTNLYCQFNALPPPMCPLFSYHRMGRL